MGYSHYWNIMGAAFWQDILPKLVEDSRKIIDASGVHVQYESDDESPPILDAIQGIQFNGRGDDGHETFDICGGDCKTDRKPYDLVVCAILLRAHQLAPSAISIRSDGNWGDWWEAHDLVSRLWPGATVSCPWEETEQTEESVGIKVQYVRFPSALPIRRGVVGIMVVSWPAGNS
ncbi:uncharacterized protein B0I36DRAFT_332587 [Microdochium trichocladiopsis]|uniref:Uncharacterized protein n=1 Tax=Microdochium trichocladiopsis TaxID=1682393 RepID=A0A9P8XZ13_9PEZI|nr:uncharacterized protein B0I36DRAFT_332587 [Microdochium trichocladiopsis]KAH7025145.1 hypothetical protein B0I36DRAFT_332587 [Microdochium trichocladiopsis]